MAIDSLSTFLDVLRRTQLLSEEQIEDIARELVPYYTEVQALGQYLVEIDWLTAYQLQMILIGRWDELTFGPYQILEQLGEGGVSQVFKAWDTHRGRIVALKVLHQHLANKTDAVRQFQRELQAITKLSHPNIIKTFDAQQDGLECYFAMEFVEGMDLDRYVQQMGPLPIEMACDYGRQVAQGLQHAHQLGLVHRDIKPANLFLLHPPLPPAPGVPLRRGPDPVVKIIDWGLARCLRDANADGSDPELSTEELEREKGSLVGTADYISPEQAQNPTLVDIRGDIYSLGCSMYYLMTGRPPFEGTSLIQKLIQHQEAPPPSLRASRPEAPEELDVLLQKMMAKSPAERPQIPLLVVTPLRRFCMSLVPAGGNSSMCGLRPSSSLTLNRPGGVAPGTALNLPRPQTHGTLARPSTSTDLPRQP